MVGMQHPYYPCLKDSDHVTRLKRLLYLLPLCIPCEGFQRLKLLVHPVNEHTFVLSTMAFVTCHYI